MTLKNFSTLVALAALLVPSSLWAEKPERPADGRALLLATTTSVQDTGLLDALRPRFEGFTGYKLKAVAVGSGEALALGRAGEVDVLLVHSPAAEEEFMREGRGDRRTALMHNWFVLVGPAADPAGVRAAPTVLEAFKRLAATNAPFVSRGDKSGTHSKELALLKSAGVAPALWAARKESGQGMADTLKVADELGAYTLSDLGSYLALKDHLQLVVLREQDDSLINRYSVIELASSRHPAVNTAGARAFAQFMTRPSTQLFIGRYGVDRVGRQLFVPDVLPARKP